MRRKSRGQSLVEFAIVIPIFMLTVLGLIDAARLVYLNSTVSQAAREGARVGSVESSYRGSSDDACGTLGGPVCPSNDSALLADIRTGANRMMVPFGTVGNVYVSCVESTGTPPSGSWTGSTCSKNSSGNLISVRVTSDFHPITPFLSEFLGTTLSGAATMTIN
jgi:Flp pilus assembly protein TadG